LTTGSRPGREEFQILAFVRDGMLKRSGGSKFGRLYVKPEVVGLVAVVISGLSDLGPRSVFATFPIA